MLPGQSDATAPAIMGDWVLLQTNGVGASAPLSVVAISQANASELTRIEPIPLDPGQTSVAANLMTPDVANNRIYSFDRGPGKVVGIDFDAATGNMSLAWTEDVSTDGWISLIGPEDQRVLLATNMNITDSSNMNAGPQNPTYTEHVQWRDADTGKLLAVSDYFTSNVKGHSAMAWLWGHNLSPAFRWAHSGVEGVTAD